MSLKYVATKNPLMEGARFYPRIVRREQVRLAELVEDLATNTALEVYDIKLVLEKLGSAMRKHLVRGRSIHTPFGKFQLRAKANLGGTKEVFSPRGNSDHILKIGYQPTGELTEFVNSQTETEAVFVNAKAPFLSALSSAEDEERTEYRSGEVMVIEGMNLRCDLGAENKDEGIYLIDLQGVETKVSIYLDNGLKTLRFKLPELAPGDYELEVRSRCANHKLRIGDWEMPLTIV